MNPDLNRLQPYPFERIKSLKEGIVPPDDKPLISLSIGEPKHKCPDFITQAVSDNLVDFQQYPLTKGGAALRTIISQWLEQRFTLGAQTIDPDQHVIPVNGTREALFAFAQCVVDPTIANAKVLSPNPFYQIYEGAAIASRAEIIHLNLTKENNFKAPIEPEVLKRCDFVIINYPNNPTAASATLEELKAWAQAALDYDFVLLNDECYSEIYVGKKDPSLLEASLMIGNTDFKNIIVVNSISKRSSAPGLRSGFIAGDAKILKAYMQYRTYVGAASPLPLQHASAAAWNDETHVANNREKYSKNFTIAKEILGIKVPSSTFYIWLEVEDDIDFTKRLYHDKNLKVLPGSFLSRGEFKTKHIRIALVENEERTKMALTRIKELLDGR